MNMETDHYFGILLYIQTHEHIFQLPIVNHFCVLHFQRPTSTNPRFKSSYIPAVQKWISCIVLLYDFPKATLFYSHWDTIMVALRLLASLPMAPQNFVLQDFSPHQGHVSLPGIDDGFATIGATDGKQRRCS